MMTSTIQKNISRKFTLRSLKSIHMETYYKDYNHHTLNNKAQGFSLSTFSCFIFDYAMLS